MRLRLAALLCCAAAAAQLTASSAGIKCDMHCAALGCATGGGAACKTCLAAHRKALEGECWASPCPSGKCFYSFEKEYCYGEGPAPPPPAPPAPPGNNSAASFYVAARGGSDSNSGSSFADAFATLQRCLSAVAAGGGGGTCWLGPGRHDMVDAAAVATSSATISGAKSGAEPAILDGSISLSSLAWSRQPQPGGAAAGASRSCIYRSSALPRPVSQLWASTAGPHSYAEGYDVLTPARFPNAKLSDDSVFRAAPSANSSMLYSTKQSTPEVLIEDGTHVPSMASSGIDFTGAIVVLPLGVMGDETQGVRVARHNVGSGNLSYTYPPGVRRELHMNNAFFLEGSCTLLDSEGEWCYDSSARSVHVWLDGCMDPSKLSFRGRVREYLLNATQLPSPGLRLERLTMWGGTLAVQRSELALDTVEMLFPTANRRVLDEVGPVRAGISLMNNPHVGRISMVNSTLEWADGTVPLNLVGANAVFRNNLFRRNGYAIGDGASISDGGLSTGMIFERNTVALFNSFSGITPGLKATLRLNEFYGQGTEADGACVHVHIKQQDGILIEKNWAHDSTVKGMRFDRVNSVNATWGVNGTFVENVVWGCASSCFKGDHHNISRNTVMEVTSGGSAADGSKTPALYVLEYNPALSWSIPGENSHTHLDSNAADSIYNVSVRGVPTLPGIHRNNVAGVPIAPMLVDPSGRDFRPKGGSALHALGAGAYDSGAPYWIPGRQAHVATHPIPADGIDATLERGEVVVGLMWRGGYEASTHRVYTVLVVGGDGASGATTPETAAHGSSRESDARRMAARASSAPDAVVSGALAQHALRVPGGSGGVVRRVLWRVDAVGEEGEVRQGDLWSFTLGLGRWGG